jgi:hypothetical protein
LALQDKAIYFYLLLIIIVTKVKLPSHTTVKNSRMADTMESQVSGEGGMNRVVSEASSKIRDHLTVATSTIDKGETELASSCSELRIRLLQELEQLASLKNLLEVIKQMNASSLEASFIEMKLKLDEVMKKTVEAIADAETVWLRMQSKLS